MKRSAFVLAVLAGGPAALASSPPPIAFDHPYQTIVDVPIMTGSGGAGGILLGDVASDGTILGSSNATILTAAVATSPMHGMLSLDSDGSFTYTPDSGFVGADAFTYTATDPSTMLTSTPATATILVRSAPAAVPPFFDSGPRATFNEGQQFHFHVMAEGSDFPLTPSVTGTLPDGVTFASESFGSPFVAVLSGTPAAGSHGTYPLTFTVSGPSGTTMQSFTLTIDDPPVTPPPNLDIAGGVSLEVNVIIGQVAMVTDPANGFLANQPAGAYTTALLDQPGDGVGTLAVNSDGTYSFDAPYPPAAPIVGSQSSPAINSPSDGFVEYLPEFGTVQLCRSDAPTVCTTSQVFGTVVATPITVDDAYMAVAGEPLVVDAEHGLSANDVTWNQVFTDYVDGPGPSHGTLVLNLDGSFSYTPDAGYAGMDGFSYCSNSGPINAGGSGCSPDAAVTFTVTAPSTTTTSTTSTTSSTASTTSTSSTSTATTATTTTSTTTSTSIGSTSSTSTSSTSSSSTSLTTASTTSSTTTTVPSPGCPLAPATDCAPALRGRASLSLTKGATPQKNKVSWKWVSAGTVALGDFGDPTMATGYVLCLYDATGRLLAAPVPPGGTCTGKPCWKTLKTGAKYSAKDPTPDGLQRVTLKAGGPGKAKIVVRGNGPALAVPTLPLTTPVHLQWRRDDAATCWDATYSHPRIDDAGSFKAKSD
jgi:hypothetical protein